MGSSETKAVLAVQKQKEMKLGRATGIIEKGALETLSYYNNFTPPDWKHIKTKKSDHWSFLSKIAK